jgi:excisionase family DNA binding protein
MSLQVLESQPGTRVPDRLLTADEVAERLSIGLSTAYLLLQRGELPSVRIGRSVRVRPEDLGRFVVARREGVGNI